MEKLTLKEVEALPVRELAEYIIDLTQTPICRDAKYCKELGKIFINKVASWKEGATV